MPLSVVTGANRGIGLALVQALARRGSEVVAVCRKASQRLRSLNVEIVEGVDVTDAGGVERLRSAIGTRSIDGLINNAGVLLWEEGGLDALILDDVRRQIEVNAIGPLRVTLALRQQLRRGSKVGLITSRMGSIQDNTSGGQYGYRMSKAALNMAGRSLAIDLAPMGVAVALLHPGMVNTEMTGGHGQVEPERAAQGLLARLDELTLQNSGRFWHANGQTLPW